MNVDIKKLFDHSVKKKKKVKSNQAYSSIFYVTFFFKHSFHFQTPEIQPKKRTKLMKFGVGFVVYHISKKKFFVILEWNVLNSSFAVYTLFGETGNVLREIPESKITNFR